MKIKQNKNNEPSSKMKDFLHKVDVLCFEYGYEIWPTIEGWTGRVDKKGNHETIGIIGNGEAVKLLYIDGDGNGE